MELDFSFQKLKKLYTAIRASDYEIVTFSDYLQGKYRKKAVILRHDVDRFVANALEVARIEKELDIQASYYFRYRNGAFPTGILKEISRWGHDIGYHYEVLAKTGGDREKAFELFQAELKHFREHVDIKTICMHGSPLSKWDSRKLWEHYNYKDLGLEGEPYFDVDFLRAAYITDTGRKWNSSKFNLRDKVHSAYIFNFRNTDEIMAAFEDEQLPDVIMMNIHPHRWHDNHILWIKELVLQNSKNILKSILTVKRMDK